MNNNGTMNATTRCQHCGKRFRIDPNPAFLPCPPTEYEGRLTRCPACKKLFTIMLEDNCIEHPRSTYCFTGTDNPNWIDDVYAGTRRRRNPERDRWGLSPFAKSSEQKGTVPLTLPVVASSARPAGTSISNRIDDVYGRLPPIDEREYRTLVDGECVACAIGGFLGFGLLFLFLAAMLFLPLLPPELAVFATMITACTAAIIGARRQYRQATRLAPERIKKQLLDKQLRQWNRDRAQRRRAAAHNPALSFKAYMAESGQGLDQLQQFFGLPPLTIGALKLVASIGRLFFSPIDYPMWRAVKQGKMRNGDRIAIQIGILYVLHRWNKTSRKRQDMRDRAECIAEAMKRNNVR
jgi:hypothetical protein